MTDCFHIHSPIPPVNWWDPMWYEIKRVRWEREIDEARRRLPKPYWPDRLDLCTPCQEDEDHHLCAEHGGILFMLRGSGREDENVTCHCHLAGHPTARDK